MLGCCSRRPPTHSLIPSLLLQSGIVIGKRTYTPLFVCL